MLVALAGVRRSLGEFKGARQALGQVLESTVKGEVVELRARIELLLIDLQTAPQAGQDTIGRIAELRAAAEAAKNEQVIALSRMAEGAVEELEGRNSAAARAFSAALEMAERHDLGRLRMEALSGLLLNELLGATAVSAAVTRCEQVLEQSNEPHVLAATLDTYALLLGMSDRTHDAIAAEERALRIAADLDDRLHEGLYRGQTLAVVYALAGDLERAQVEARRGCELLLNLEAQAWLSSAACVLVEIEISRGNLQEADRWLSVAEASSVATDIDARTRAAVSRSRLALIGGEPEVARALIGVAAKSVEGTELLYLQGIVAAAEASVAAATGDRPLALRRLAEAAQIHDLKGDAARSRRARELADRLATDAQAWRTVALV